LGRSDGDQPEGDVARVESREPTPKFAAIMVEECRGLLGRLRDDSLRALALLRLEGFTNEEVAQRLGCSLRTVARKMELIRRSWSSEEVTQ
jgi:DNA-directed RNA polymerase specialized sigma24 family protein